MAPPGTSAVKGCGIYQTIYPVLPATFAIAFLGTPHRGSEYADWGQIDINIANAALLDTDSSIVEGLKVDNGDLNMLHEAFSVMLKSSQFKVNTFQEGKGLVGAKGLNKKVGSYMLVGLVLRRLLTS
jgi:hypothetical protein